MKIRAFLIFVLALLFSSMAFAHCDTLSGPVVRDAKQALAQKNVAPVLKWVKQGDEAEVRRVFEQTLKVRGLGAEAQQLADRFFFETLVRLHRAGEGAPYTGLKDESPEPVIQLTDEALASGSSDALLQALNGHLKTELTKRFEAVRAAKAEAATSTEAGRRYVAAYVELTHFVEGLHTAMLKTEAHQHGVE